MILVLKYIFGFFTDLHSKEKNEKINNTCLWREESQILCHFHYILQQQNNIIEKD